MNHRKSVVLFFTYGKSLRDWDRQMILEREVALYKRLFHDGARVAFVTYGTESDFQYANRLDGIEIIPAYAYRKRPRLRFFRFLDSFLLAFRLRRRLREYSLFKTNQMWGAWVALIAKWITGNKLFVRTGYDAYEFSVYQRRHWAWRKGLYYLTKLLYRFSDAIAVSSKSSLNSALSKFQVSRNKIFVVPNIVDTQLFSRGPRSQANARILFVGRLREVKNVKNLITAVQMAGKSLDIVGEGPLLGSLRKYAEEIRADVNFLPPLPNFQLPTLLEQYEIVTSPSFYECNPKFILEAMSCEKVVLASKVPGITEIITHGFDGILTGTEPEEIAQAISLIWDDKNLKSRIGHNARKTILKNNGIDVILKKEEEIYRQLMQCYDQKNTEENYLQLQNR